MRRRLAKFYPRELKLVVRGFKTSDQPPASLLQPLTEDGIIRDVHMRRVLGGQRLEIVLRNPEQRPSAAILCRFAYRLSRTKKYGALHEPCTLSGPQLDLDMLAELIGDVLRAEARDPFCTKRFYLAR